ncbi:MAG: hypothetical protein AAFV29_04680, partial [Myxococcota bacterium]
GVTVSGGRAEKFIEVVDASPPPLAEAAADEVNLDFALIRLKSAIGEEARRVSQMQEQRGWVNVPRDALDVDDVSGIAVLQHLGEKPLQLALASPAELTTNENKSRVSYKLSAPHASRGAPVFDSEWNLIALHHASADGVVQGVPTHLIAQRDKVRAAIGR